MFREKRVRESTPAIPVRRQGELLKGALRGGIPPHKGGRLRPTAHRGDSPWLRLYGVTCSEGNRQRAAPARTAAFAAYNSCEGRCIKRDRHLLPGARGVFGRALIRGGIFDADHSSYALCG